MALIDKLPLPKRQINTLRNLHTKVNTRGESVTRLTGPQFDAIQAAYDATKLLGPVDPLMIKYATDLGIKL
jgi:hypothetical protein